MRLEVIWVLQSFSDDSVVVYLAIDCKSNALVFGGKRLRTTLDTDDTQTLVSKDCPPVSDNNPKLLPFKTYWCCWQDSCQTNPGLYVYIV